MKFIDQSKSTIATLLTCLLLFVTICGHAYATPVNNGELENFSVIEDNQDQVVSLFKNDEVSIYTTYNKKTEEITAKVTENSNNVLGLSLVEPEATEYKVEVDTAMNGEFKASAIDTETNEEIVIDTSDPENEEAVAQVVVPLIPVVEWLGAAILATLAVAAVMYIAGEKAVSVSEADVQTNIKRDPTAYYHAAVNFSNNQVYIGNKVNYNGAKAWLNASRTNNIFTLQQKRARTLAENVGTDDPVLDERESQVKGEGYYEHYHPRDKGMRWFERKQNHIWFLIRNL